MRALVDGHWKLIEYHVNGERHTQLFDLSADPHEETNLAENPAQSGRIVALRQSMIEERDLYEDHDAKFWKDIGFGSPPSTASSARLSMHTAQQE
jgi:arylsulfatase A-like enzyme